TLFRSAGRLRRDDGDRRGGGSRRLRPARSRGGHSSLGPRARRAGRRRDATADRSRDGRRRHLRALPRTRARDRDARHALRVALRHRLRRCDGRAARDRDRLRAGRPRPSPGRRAPVGPHRRRDDRRGGAPPLDRLTDAGSMPMRAMRLASGPVRENACPLRHPAHPLAKAVRPARPARRRARSALGHLAVALGAATVAALTASLPAHAQAPTRAPATVVGDWLGTLEVPGARLRIVFHIVEDEGGLTATMDSPDQGAFGIETGAVVLAGDSLTIEVPAAFGRYTGEVRGDTITGTWSQGGASLPLVLARTEGVEAPRRPQHPEPPFPYDAVDVTIPTDEPGVTLAGTLTKPHGDGPFPAVVLISGSGPQDRDETVSGHKPFLVIADALTRRGVAVLRYDDRGFGGSTGNFATATTADFANDALAAVRFLVGRDDIDPARIGLIGHSE